MSSDLADCCSVVLLLEINEVLRLLIIILSVDIFRDG